jgi:Protein of unknown function DUF262
MDTPLNASASSAGAIFSNNTFDIPRYQRDYSWGLDQVKDFWSDLSSSLELESYFLGLVILTNPAQDEAPRKHVVDGQQRIITLSLLVTALYYEALRRDRKALAERIQGTFLRSIDYDSDDQLPRVKLSDKRDNETFSQILNTGKCELLFQEDTVSGKIHSSYEYLSKQLQTNLAKDPFKRLGKWTDFLTNRLYFALFVHPDASSAYQVFEVINTRGKDLTTADLLKNYVLSQTAPSQQEETYDRWQLIASAFSSEETSNLVQYIRHVVTVDYGHVLPKDLFGFVAGRIRLGDRQPPSSPQLLDALQSRLPLYQQLMDPTLPGPADSDALPIFAALNMLGVIAVRPILLACAETGTAVEGMKYILRLVVRRIVVGNLGTGNVERRFGEAAKRIKEEGKWESMIEVLRDLNPTKEQFVQQLTTRSLNKQILYFMRRSIIEGSITPSSVGTLQFIWTKQAPFEGMGEDEGSYWASTLGNTFLSTLERRPKSVTTWQSFKQEMIPAAVPGEKIAELNPIDKWSADEVERIGKDLASTAGEIWFNGE